MAPKALAPEPSGRAPQSLDEAISDLGKLQLMLAVPSVSALRTARPLRRSEGELYVAQFVLQSTHRKFNKFLSTPEGKCELHPCLKLGTGSLADGMPDGDGSFGCLDDGTPVIYQTNGIARIEESKLNRAIKCSRTGAPGHYMETKMLVAKPRDTAGISLGLARAKVIQTRKDLESNLYYSFTSCWQIYACSARVGELGEDDSGERILVRRSVRDFRQHHFHDFPVAKHLADLLDRENQILVTKHSFELESEVEKAKRLAQERISGGFRARGLYFLPKTGGLVLLMWGRRKTKIKHTETYVYIYIYIYVCLNVLPLLVFSFSEGSQGILLRFLFCFFLP